MFTSNTENNISTLSYRTIIEALSNSPAEKLFATMWNNEDDIQSVSFGEFLEQAQAQAEYFRAHGLNRGETVILIMPQGIALMAAFAGAMLLGAVPAILAYPNFKVEPDKYRSGLEGVSANLNARLIVIDNAFPQEMLGYVTVAEGGRLLFASDKQKPSAQMSLLDSAFDSEALAFIQHSAGTTGLQKGVALSHAAVLRQLNHLAQTLQISNQDRIYSWLPLYHDMGLIACFILPLVYHLPVIMQSPTDWVMQPGTMLQLITKFKCTLAWTPNFTLQFLSRRVHPDDREEFDLSSLRALINCSEPVRAQSIDEFRKTYDSAGLKPEALQSSYAMAENVFAVTQSDIHSPPRRVWVDGERLRERHLAGAVPANSNGAVCFVSSGQCLPCNEVKIVSSAGKPLPDGAVGEILISSDSLFNGYYNRPDLTEKALQSGWYWSGDLGFLLDGELYVIGRKKDLIIVAGKNIYPQDVEEIVYTHPSIHDGRSVSLGLYNPDLGTEDIVVVAEVEKEEDLKDALSIERYLRGAIVAELGVAVRAVYLKPPRWIVKSTAGKPARKSTCEKLLAEHPELNRMVFASGETFDDRTETANN
ncbi:MAG: AMP-binding protein [Pyrinomonadaceae bacterium]